MSETSYDGNLLNHFKANSKKHKRNIIAVL